MLAWSAISHLHPYIPPSAVSSMPPKRVLISMDSISLAHCLLASGWVCLMGGAIRRREDWQGSSMRIFILLAPSQLCHWRLTTSFHQTEPFHGASLSSSNNHSFPLAFRTRHSNSSLIPLASGYFDILCLVLLTLPIPTVPSEESFGWHHLFLTGSPRHDGLKIKIKYNKKETEAINFESH